jgi:3'-5' exoribonuclease Rv2179c-like domain
MNDIMLDIETLGTTPGHIVTSFCAVKFDLEKPSEITEFHRAISIKSSLKVGLKIDLDTMLWWMKQNDDSRKYFIIQNEKYGEEIEDVLYTFGSWIANYPKATLWGNGNRFDCGILEGAYQALGLPTPWITKNERDMRTYIMGFEHYYESSATRDTIHDSRKDCIYQIEVLQKVYNTKQILHEHFERASLSR